MTEDKKPARPKRRIGRIVTLSILGLIVLVLAAGAALYFRVPQNMGLIKSPADKLFTGTPDREKAAVVMQSLQEVGLNTKGVEIYVLPVSGTDRNVAVIVLDASKGFSLTGSRSTDIVKDFTTVVSQAQQLGIDRAAVQYRDESGKELASVTVPTDAVLAYSQKRLTDRQLMEKVDVSVGDVSAAINLLQQQLK